MFTVTASAEPLRVGLVGSGPWAAAFHGPALLATPEVSLTAVWSPTRAHASTLARALGTTPVASFEALLGKVEAIAFAVAPAAQPELAMAAISAGRAVLLEKPLALTASAADELAGAVAASGVPAALALTYRLCPGVADFVHLARRDRPTLIGATFISGALRADRNSAAGWRYDRGIVVDIGSHVFDLVEAIGGAVTSVAACQGSAWTSTLCEHATGAVSHVDLTGDSPVQIATLALDVRGAEGGREMAIQLSDRHAVGKALYRRFAGLVRDPARAERGDGLGAGGLPGVQRGAHLVRIVEALTLSLERRAAVPVGPDASGIGSKALGSRATLRSSLTGAAEAAG